MQTGEYVDKLTKIMGLPSYIVNKQGASGGGYRRLYVSICRAHYGHVDQVYIAFEGSPPKLPVVMYGWQESNNPKLIVDGTSLHPFSVKYKKLVPVVLAFLESYCAENNISLGPEQ